MNSLRQVFARHWLAFVGACAVACLMLLPHYLFRSAVGAEYAGIPLMYSDAEVHYLARISAVAFGRGASNPYLYEYKEELNPLYEPIEGLLALPARALGVPVPILNLWYKALFPALFFLLVYALLFRFLRDRLWSFAGASLVLFGYHFLSSVDFAQFLQGRPMTTEFTRWARPVNPQVSSLFFFVYLHALYSVFRGARNSAWVLLAVIFSVSFYVYFYLWTFLLALSVFFVAFFFLAQRKGDAVRMSGVIAVALFFGLPRILDLYGFWMHPFGHGLGGALNLMSTRSVVLSVGGVLAGVALLLWRYFRFEDKYLFSFLAVLLLSAFGTINQQIVTGVLLQDGHFHWYFNVPIYTLVLVVVLARLFRNRAERTGAMCAVFLCSVSFYAGFSDQVSSVRHWTAEGRRIQAYAPLFNWLNKNVEPESVISGPSAFVNLVPLYTRLNVAWSEYAAFYLVPRSRVEEGKRLLEVGGVPRGEAFRIDYVLLDECESTQKDEYVSWHAREVYRSGSLAIVEL